MYTSFDVTHNAGGRREINCNVDLLYVFRCECRGFGVLLGANDMNPMFTLARHLRHQRSSLSATQNQQVHVKASSQLAGKGSRNPLCRLCDILTLFEVRCFETQAKTSGSSSPKKVPCSLLITSGTSSSSITKVRLISEAPCEIMRIFLSASLPNTNAATPGVSRKFSPTRQMIAFRPSYFTSASLARSAASAGMAWFESTVRETLTSEVETTSTATLCRSKASKIARRNPCASSMRGAATSTIVMRFFTAIALKMFLPWGARVVIFVPSQEGLRELRT